MKDFQIYEAYRIGNVPWFASLWIAIAVLALHSLIGSALVLYGCKQKRWE